MTIICGTDLSEASKGALDVARALAAHRGDKEVVLVHVVETEDSEGPGASQLDALRTQLEAHAKVSGEPSVRAELVVGVAEDVIVGLADVEASDLIVIAAQSRVVEPVSRLGTTAGKVIAKTHVPVIIVRDPAPWLHFAHGDRPLKVLLGIDESATCDLGIQWTQALRKQGPVEVVLGAIYYPDDAAAHYGLHARALVETDPEIERLMARDLLRRFGGDGKHVVAQPRRGLGRIGDHIIELARDEHVDAIVVGTGQKTGLGRLGSVSTVIVNDAPQSVVCVPPQAVVITQSVPVLHQALVATDLSQFANRAVPYAFALTAVDGEVHVLHVIKEDAEVDEADLVRQLRALAPAGAPQKVSALVVRGDDAATTMAQTAARLGVDVICIASHGRSGITRALVGSVADRLLRATRLPVLVLRPA